MIYGVFLCLQESEVLRMNGLRCWLYDGPTRGDKPFLSLELSDRAGHLRQ
jgi:hypothetical protein